MLLGLWLLSAPAVAVSINLSPEQLYRSEIVLIRRQLPDWGGATTELFGPSWLHSAGPQIFGRLRCESSLYKIQNTKNVAHNATFTEQIMAHVVTGNCELCRFTDCAVTCPVQCFHGDADRLYIDPETCIDCGACIPACPVNAILEEFDLTDDQKVWQKINAERAASLPVISSKQDPLPTAAQRKRDLDLLLSDKRS